MVELVRTLEAEAEDMPEVLVWNVVFLKAETRRHLLDLFTPPDWRHCVAFGFSQDRWIVYDVGDVRSQILVLRPYQFDIWISGIEPRITAAVQIHTKEAARPLARVGLWCVTAIKHLTGIRSGAFTPKALFRDLLANGGKVHEHYGQGENTQAPGKS
ncbi:MAG: hypothetical protein AAGK93_00100 [Pseudomonadota bacterium]